MYALSTRLIQHYTGTTSSLQHALSLNMLIPDSMLVLQTDLFVYVMSKWKVQCQFIRFIARGRYFDVKAKDDRLGDCTKP
jgi:hypothetical protein